MQKLTFFINRKRDGAYWYGRVNVLKDGKVIYGVLYPVKRLSEQEAFNDAEQLAKDLE